MTAECAAPLVRSGGLVIVSAASDTDRWPAGGVPELGRDRPVEWRATDGSRFLRMRRSGPVCDRHPRRPAAQRRSPLF
jgi:hypothetical protein